jgi:hypothetical protein
VERSCWDASGCFEREVIGSAERSEETAMQKRCTGDAKDSPC